MAGSTLSPTAKLFLCLYGFVCLALSAAILVYRFLPGHTWANASGQVGQLNFEAVEEALCTSGNFSEFARQVNQIYQGEELILVRALERYNQYHIHGFADLDNSGRIGPNAFPGDCGPDEALFEIRVWYEQDGSSHKVRQYTILGYGINAYYYCRRKADLGIGALTILMLEDLHRISSRRPYYLITCGISLEEREQYRRTPVYRQRVKWNQDFQRRMAARPKAPFPKTGYQEAQPDVARYRWARRKGINLTEAIETAKK